MGKKWQKNALAGQTADRKTFWFMRILRLASSSIVWDGLPDYIPLQKLEWDITVSGRAILLRDPVTDKYIEGTDSSCGNLSIYGQPLDRAATLGNGDMIRSDIYESVLISNNVMSLPDLWMYETMAAQLADLDIAIKVNCSTQKTMPIIPTTVQQKLTIENAYNMREQNVPYLLVDAESMDIAAFNQSLQFDNRKSFTADQLMVVQRELWGRCLTILGINNANIEKRERVNTFETNSNLDEILVMRNSRLEARRYACRLMKQKWNLDVDVAYVGDLGLNVRGGGNYGMVYDTSADDMRAGMAGQQSGGEPSPDTGKSQ